MIATPIASRRCVGVRGNRAVIERGARTNLPRAYRRMVRTRPMIAVSLLVVASYFDSYLNSGGTLSATKLLGVSLVE